jgi:hypothetical protein
MTMSHREPPGYLDVECSGVVVTSVPHPVTPEDRTARRLAAVGGRRSTRG